MANKVRFHKTNIFRFDCVFVLHTIKSGEASNFLFIRPLCGPREMSCRVVWKVLTIRNAMGVILILSGGVIRKTVESEYFYSLCFITTDGTLYARKEDGTFLDKIVT